jgi:hypothetical protein
MAELSPPGPPPMIATRRVGKAALGMIEEYLKFKGNIVTMG